MEPVSPQTLEIPVPTAQPEWRTVRSLSLKFWYAMKRPEFDDAHEAIFLREARRVCGIVVDRMKRELAPGAVVHWRIEATDVKTLADMLKRDLRAKTWFVAVDAALDPTDRTTLSLVNEWAPLYNAVLHFAMPTDEPNIPEVLGTNDAETIIINRLPPEAHPELAALSRMRAVAANQPSSFEQFVDLVLNGTKSAVQHLGKGEGLSPMLMSSGDKTKVDFFSISEEFNLDTDAGQATFAKTIAPLLLQHYAEHAALIVTARYTGSFVTPEDVAREVGLKAKRPSTPPEDRRVVLVTIADRQQGLLRYWGWVHGSSGASVMLKAIDEPVLRNGIEEALLRGVRADTK